MAYHVTDSLEMALIRAGMRPSDARILVKRKISREILWKQTSYQEFRLNTGYRFDSADHAANLFYQACFGDWQPPKGYMPNGDAPSRQVMAPISGNDLTEVSECFDELLSLVRCFGEQCQIDTDAENVLLFEINELLALVTLIIRAGLANDPRDLDREGGIATLSAVLKKIRCKNGWQ